MNAAERAALRAALQLGLPAFPCRADKSPACPHGFKDATLPEAGLATLWARYPGELVGVPTGEITGFDILDVDGRNGGGEWWAAHKAKLPQTRMHRTRSGGLHVFFRHLDGLRNSAGKIAPGVDIRADGGYIAWWPASGLEVRDHPLSALPEWPVFLLIKLFPEPKSISARAQSRYEPPGSTLDAKLHGIAARIERAREGERNSVLYWGACRFGELVRDGIGIDEGWLAELLEVAAAKSGLPPDEARRTIKSGFAHAR
jgi:hypothetical protein